MPAPFDFRDPDNLHTLGHIQGGAQRRKLAEQSEETNRLLKEQNRIEWEKRYLYCHNYNIEQRY